MAQGMNRLNRHTTYTRSLLDEYRIVKQADAKVPAPISPHEDYLTG